MALWRTLNLSESAPPDATVPARMLRLRRCRGHVLAHEARAAGRVREVPGRQVYEPRDFFDLRVVDAIPGVVRGVVVGMLAGVEQHHRHRLDRERIVIAAREPALAVVLV